MRGDNDRQTERELNVSGPKGHTLRRVSTAPATQIGRFDAITSEQRRHLDHLAPSNLAHSPKQTRYTNVKIKRAQVDRVKDNRGGEDREIGSTAEQGPVVNSPQSKVGTQKQRTTKDSGADDESTPLLS